MQQPTWFNIYIYIASIKLSHSHELNGNVRRGGKTEQKCVCARVIPIWN